MLRTSQVQLNSRVSNHDSWFHDQVQTPAPKRFSLLHAGTPDRLKKHIAKHVQEHAMGSILYIPERTTLAWNADTKQVFQHYASYSIRKDVSFYFNDSEPDWRLKYLQPLCFGDTISGSVLSSLFASLHRLVSNLQGI